MVESDLMLNTFKIKLQRTVTFAMRYKVSWCHKKIMKAYSFHSLFITFKHTKPFPGTNCIGSKPCQNILFFILNIRNTSKIRKCSINFWPIFIELFTRIWKLWTWTEKRLAFDFYCMNVNTHLYWQIKKIE